MGGKITFTMPYEGSPLEAQVPAEWRKKILHAALSVNGGLLQGADTPPGRYQKPQGFALALEIKEPAEAQRTFQALAEQGEITMPMQETFWAKKFGMLTDRFGIPWMVNCSKPM